MAVGYFAKVDLMSTDSAEELQSLCSALAVAVEASKGIPSNADQRVLDAEALAVKCFFHASSCLQLAQGTPIPNRPTRVLDPQ